MLVVVFVADHAHAGKLDDVRDRVYQDDDDASRDRDRDDGDHGDDYDYDYDDHDEPSILAALLVALFGGHGDSHSQRNVHFYEEERIQSEVESDWSERTLSGQVSASSTYLDPEFLQWQFSSEVQIFDALEIAVGYELFREGGQDDADSLGIARVGMGLVVGSDELGIRLVPGVHYLRFDDTPRGENGAEVSARLELFPGSVVFRIEARTGVIGDATTRAGGLELGYRFGQTVEVYGGFGGRTFEDLELTGPRGGVKLWF